MIRLLDTNAVVYLQKGLLAEVLPPGEYAISVITEMELLSYRGLIDEQKIWLEEFISNLQVYDIDKDIKQCAIELRRDYQMRLPDAIIAATAISRKALLLTNDADFSQVPALHYQQLLLNP
ncbi:MAG: hypothetical protein QG652_749 [Pseudomonadota bacterium]|nr:hypothetical protein [Pseudomonadota bacterium]